MANGVVVKTFVLGSHGSFDTDAEESPLACLVAPTWYLARRCPSQPAYVLLCRFGEKSEPFPLIGVFPPAVFPSFVDVARYFPTNYSQLRLGKRMSAVWRNFLATG
jgi:hypothetical protein